MSFPGSVTVVEQPRDSLPRETVTAYAYTYVFFPSLPCLSIFLAAKNEKNTELRWIHGGVLGSQCTAQVGRGEYTRRARRIMGICGRQVAKLYREAGNKRANGSYVRREILWRRACKGLGSACGLTSIKPSKSYLSRLATGGLILLFNVCSLSLSLVFLFFLLLSFLFLFPSLPFFFRGIIFFVARSCFSLLGPLSILFFLLSFPSSFFFCSLLAAYSGRYLVTIPRESRTGWLVGNVT